MKNLKVFILISIVSSVFANAGAETEKSVEKANDKLQAISDKTFIASKSHKEENSPKIRESFLTSVMNDVMKDTFEKMLEENPLSRMSKLEVENLILRQTSSSPLGEFLQTSPRLLSFFTDWFRDKRALPKLFGIINKPDKVKKYGFIVIGIFVASFILNLFNTKGNILKRFFYKFIILISIIIINFTVFYFMFTPNIKPTIHLLLRNFHF